jgi:hypothetical protein
MMNELFEQLSRVIDRDSFLRIDAKHPLDLYIGLDEFSQTTFLILSNEKSRELKSSNLIDIKVDVRTDLRNAISLSLKDDNYKDIFLYFINEIIESSRNYDAEKGYKFVFNRITKWQSMLSKIRPGIMSNSEIKGLLGELVVLDKIVAQKSTHDYAVTGWIGSEGAKQDFVFEKSWIEVKSTSSGSDSVTISSVEQLDTKDIGELIVVNLDKSSELDESAYSVNDYVNYITEKINDMTILEQFQTMLLKRGYHYNRDYEKIRFKLGEIRNYIVDNSFPCLRRNDLPNSIIDCRYDISLISIIEKYVGGL